MVSKAILTEKYTQEPGRVFMTGTQALVRLPIVQMRRDRAAGLNTGAFISGYRGSPLGAYDRQLTSARAHLNPLDIVFQPGINEDLAATAVWGSQQLHLSTGARKDGLVGIWYGKGPGVDRSGDVFRHANAAGTAPKGGVLALAGDDHTCKSSTIPHQSDHAFIAAMMPYLYPASIHDFVEAGLLGIAMSRFSGCWTGFKVISETVETTGIVDLAGEARAICLPENFAMPPGGLGLRWPDAPLDQDDRLHRFKIPAALAFARANRLDRETIRPNRRRFGIVASGKAHEDVRQALAELGLGREEAEAIGLGLYKVLMPWPLEPAGMNAFAEGLEEILVVEERRDVIEGQLRQMLYSAPADRRPRLSGKGDPDGRPLVSSSAGLSVQTVAEAIAARLLRLDLPDGLAASIRGGLARLTEVQDRIAEDPSPIARRPHFCAGCPHNISTRVPDGSKAMAGIGCHYMSIWMDRDTETFTQMGGEGVPWTAISRFTDESHRFVNLGDGTYVHSGSLAVRQAVASGATMTFKILYNDAVAMTGGQSIDGNLTPAAITHQMAHEGVGAIRLVTDTPKAYAPAELAAGTTIHHRDEIDGVMEELAKTDGVSILLYVQTCATEARRRRKRGLEKAPQTRVFIDPAICEGCGDCSAQSNCIAIEPLETEMGRKRQINQSLCNKDLSCLKGFCPAFVTLEGAEVKRPAVRSAPDLSDLPQPVLPALGGGFDIAVTGVGGTGVLTIGAILGLAAHLDGKGALILDMAGLAQKGGAVLSHVRLGEKDDNLSSPRIAPGRADLLIAADAVVAAGREGSILCDPSRTEGIVNRHVAPVADFVGDPNFDFRTASVLKRLANQLRDGGRVQDFAGLARKLFGDEIAANMMMLGFAWQAGLLPLSHAAIEGAIAANGVAVETNQAAFAFGRHLAHRPDEALATVGSDAPARSLAVMSIEEIRAHREDHLSAYQGPALAKRYRARIERLDAAILRAGIERPIRDEITRAVAINYARLLAYKDEYEVARLMTRPEAKAIRDAAFTGTRSLAFHLAPPFLGGHDASGRAKKRAFGAWTLPFLKLLARMKPLRGTPFDPFGPMAERRAERALIAAYEADLDLVEAALSRPLSDTAIAVIADLLRLPETIRGFGPVKGEAMAKADEQRKRLHARLETGLSRAMPEESPRRAA